MDRARINRGPLIRDRLEVEVVANNLHQDERVASIEALLGQVGLQNVA